MPTLTRDEAAARAALLRVRGYDIDLDLAAARGSAHFTSTTTVRFGCATPGADTFVELKPVALAAVTLNGVPLDAAALVDNRLPLTGLRAENELVVTATMAYSTSGDGLHRFVDPDDGEVYLHAQAGPDEGQRFFACFDQPDLKAPVRLSVTAPTDWTVWANGAGTRGDGTRGDGPGRWDFAPTRPLATYLVTVVAGPYHARYAEHDGIPLGLVCRPAYADALDRDADELFAITAECLDRYHALFGIRYPYGRYDQVFVPELNAGAVENPGCVAFREEGFLFRSGATEPQRSLRAVVMAHEMAHMWFGDLVTLRWWDGIWLNESFAEYLGWRVTAEGGRFPDAWTAFALGRKATGYAADQRPSTHPVAPSGVDDVGTAALNFDGISYAKGASVLRQLVAWVGDEAFFAGLRAYFAAHAHGNATLGDLLAALSAASGRDLTGWAEVWLQRAQVNTLRPEVTLGADGRYAEVAIVQTAPADHPTLRPHRLSVAVYDGDGPVRRVRAVAVDLDPAVDGGRTLVPALAGTAPGRLLLVNDGDLTYAKVRLDSAGPAVLAEVLPALDDPLARVLVWSAVMDACRDAELEPTAFVWLVATALPAEGTVTTFEEVLRLAREVVVNQYFPAADRPAGLGALADLCFVALRQAPPGGGLQLAAARGLVSCTGVLDAARLAGWLAGEGAPAGLAVDTDLRWAALYRLVVLGRAGEAEIAAEQARDAGASGAEHAARCRAALADPAAKARAWQLIAADEALPARLIMATAQGFWHPEQEELTAGYVARYATDMPAMAARRTPQAVAKIAAAAYPRYAVSAATLAAAEAMLDGGAELTPALRRVVVDGTDDLRRALAARNWSDR